MKTILLMLWFVCVGLLIVAFFYETPGVYKTSLVVAGAVIGATSILVPKDDE